MEANILEQQKRFLKSLLEGNKMMCSLIINKLIEEKYSFDEIYENIIKKSLYEIGELWEKNKISVATEHLASAIVEMILNEIYQKIIKHEPKKGLVVVSCIEKEYHQIGAKMISDCFEANEWKTIFLGANVPVKDLVMLVKSLNPQILALSLTLYFNLPILIKTINEVRKNFPELVILVGGQAFNHGGVDIVKSLYKVFYLPDVKTVNAYIKNLNSYE